MAASRKAAFDLFFRYKFFYHVDRSECSREHSSGRVYAIALDQRFQAELHAGEHHAAVARARAPTDAVGLKHRNLSPKFCQGSRRGKAGKTGAYDDDIHPLGQITRSSSRHLYGTQPVVGWVEV